VEKKENALPFSLFEKRGKDQKSEGKGGAEPIREFDRGGLRAESIIDHSTSELRT
jgi:hypothetical protein